VAGLRKVFDSLPPKSKLAVRQVFNPKTKDPNEKTVPNWYLTGILQVKTIALPEEVHDVFKKCKAKPSEFWISVGLRSTGEIYRPQDSYLVIALSQVYLGIKSFAIKRTWDTIIWRFYTLFLYELALLIADGGVHITNNIIEQLFVIITASPAINDDSETIRENLRKWTSTGCRYYSLCSSLSPGVLFLLPPLSDNT
jgi:hypothetical protein